jgi:condensin complex subunit 1
MDVDEDEPDNEDDSEEDEDMLGEERPTRKKKKAKKPRRSSLNMTALGDEQAALAALETSTIDKLRLMKKYHAEALNFIKQLEECMETMADLLGSKSKPEVLEVIEFFKAANQLSVEGAQVTAITKTIRVL